MIRVEKCCSFISLEAGSIAIAVIHIVIAIYFLVLGLYPIGIIVNAHSYPKIYYYIFAMAILVSETFFLFVTCASLIVGVKKRMPNYLMPFMIWVCISHFILNTAFLIYTLHLYYTIGSTSFDPADFGLHYQYIGKCVVYYVLGAISFIVVFLQFRALKDERKNMQQS